MPGQASSDRDQPAAQGTLGSVSASDAPATAPPARPALAEVLAASAICGGQQARGADALVAEQASALTVASLLLWTTTRSLATGCDESKLRTQSVEVDSPGGPLSSRRRSSL
jgi:hypothetical protein